MQPSPRASELSYPCPICADCSRKQVKSHWSFAKTYLRPWAFVETSQEFCWKLFFKVLEAIILHIYDILTIASKVETGSCSDIVPLPAAGDGNTYACNQPAVPSGTSCFCKLEFLLPYSFSFPPTSFIFNLLWYLGNYPWENVCIPDCQPPSHILL